jgi:hypothetical protein
VIAITIATGRAAGARRFAGSSEIRTWQSTDDEVGGGRLRALRKAMAMRPSDNR